MSYSGDPANSGVDAVRFWAQDTGTTGLLNDEEIEYLITFSGLDPVSSPLDIAALAADRIAAKYAGEVSISADGVSYSGDQLYLKYVTLAKELRQSARQMAGWNAQPFVGGLRWGRNLGVGMHDNPTGSRQILRRPDDEYLQGSSDYDLQENIDPLTGRVG